MESDRLREQLDEGRESNETLAISNVSIAGHEAFQSFSVRRALSLR